VEGGGPFLHTRFLDSLYKKENKTAILTSATTNGKCVLGKTKQLGEGGKERFAKKKKQ